MLFALAVVAAQVSPAPVPSVASPAATTPGVPKRICRREQTTGSIMPGRRVCRTAAEWATVDGSRADGVNAFRSRPTRAVSGER